MFGISQRTVRKKKREKESGIKTDKRKKEGKSRIHALVAFSHSKRS